MLVGVGRFRLPAERQKLVAQQLIARVLEHGWPEGRRQRSLRLRSLAKHVEALVGASARKHGHRFGLS